MNMNDNLKALRNVYTIEEMVQICVKGDVVTAANAEYLRRNLGEFFGELNNALRESQYMYAELEERLANNHAAMSIYQRDIAALRERVAALEAAIQQMVYHFDTGIGNTPEEQESIDNAVALVKSHHNPATAKGGE